MIELVLLDLDGTLADTAPDLGGALNALRAERNLPPTDVDALRPAIGAGTPAILNVGLGINKAHPEFERLRQRFLDLYAQRLTVGTRLYPGTDDLLDELEAQDLRWGIVTNKPQRFTTPLVEALGLAKRAACVVSGDQVHAPKPAPDALILAARKASVAPTRGLYLGDSPTDVVAARAAGMRALVAGWGYIVRGDDPMRWNPDAVLAAPKHLIAWLLVHG